MIEKKRSRTQPPKNNDSKLDFEQKIKLNSKLPHKEN